MRILILVFLCSLYSKNDGYALEKEILETKGNEFQFKIPYIHDLILNKGFNCTDIIDYFLERAYTFNPKLNAIIAFNPNAKAEAIKQDIYFHENKKPIGKLHCIPTLIKDNIDVKDIPTTSGIRAFRNVVPLEDSLVVELLRKEGAIVLAKANLAELAIGIVLDSETGGLCNNPYDLKRTCSGSSSGSAAGIAGGMSVIGIGTDTSGSILVPSSFSGLFGLRPIAGESTPLDGILPLFDRSDTVGPMVKYLDDLVLVHSIINQDASIYERFKQDIVPSELKVGIFPELIYGFKLEQIDLEYNLESEVKIGVNSTLEAIKKSGISVVDFGPNNPVFLEMSQTVALLLDAYIECIPFCLKDSYTRYFSKTSRFDIDSPYHSFDDILYNPKLLSNVTLDMFNQVNELNETYCIEDDNCKTYDRLQAYLNQILVNSSILADYDALMLPTSAVLPYFHDRVFSPSELITLFFLSPLSRFPSLNVPAFFSEKEKLPVGMLFLSKPDRLDKTFKIASLLEKSKRLDTLPVNTPILRDLSPQDCNNNGVVLNKFNFGLLSLSLYVAKFFYNYK